MYIYIYRWNMMKHFVLWGMDVENTWRTHPWISNSLLGMRCMTLPKKLPRWWFFQFHMFWQLFASDSDMFNVFDGPFRGNRWFVSFPHQKSSPPSQVTGQTPIFSMTLIPSRIMAPASLSTLPSTYLTNKSPKPIWQRRPRNKKNTTPGSTRQNTPC